MIHRKHLSAVLESTIRLLLLRIPVSLADLLIQRILSKRFIERIVREFALMATAIDDLKHC